MNVVAFKDMESGWDYDEWVLRKRVLDMRRDFTGFGGPVKDIVKVCLHSLSCVPKAGF